MPDAARPASVIAQCALAGAFLLAGCGGASKIVNPINTGGSIKVQISRSSTPEFTWESGVEVQAISVSNFGPTGTVDRILWGYRNVAVKPPVLYGKRFDSGINLAPGSAPPLQSGARYRVEVVQNNEASFADWLVP